MLEKIYFYAKTESSCPNIEKSRGFKELSLREGWIMVSDEDEIFRLMKQAAEEENALIITNDENILPQLNQGGLPVVLWCENPEEVSVYGVDMIIENLEDADRLFLNLIFNRRYGIPVTIAVTPRLLIRESMGEDLNDFYRIYEEERNSGFVPELWEERVKEEEALSSYIKNMYGFYGYGLWSVCSREDLRIIGRAGFENFVYKGEAVVELGIVIEKKSRGLGIASEAFRAILTYGKKNFLFSEVYMRIDSRNLKSVSLAKRLGFLLEEDGEVQIYKNSTLL